MHLHRSLLSSRAALLVLAFVSIALGSRAAMATVTASCNLVQIQTVPGNPYGRTDGKPEIYPQCFGTCDFPANSPCLLTGGPADPPVVGSSGSFGCTCIVELVVGTVWEFFNHVKQVFFNGPATPNPYFAGCTGEYTWTCPSPGRVIGGFSCTGTCPSGNCAPRQVPIMAPSDPANPNSPLIQVGSVIQCDCP